MTQWTSLLTGTDGAAVTSAAISPFSWGSSGTPAATFSAAQALAGLGAATAILGPQTANQYFGVIKTGLATTHVSASLLFKFNRAMPGTNDYLFDIRTSSSLVRCLVNASNMPFVQLSGSVVWTGSTPLVYGQWYRLNVGVTVSATTGAINVDFYDAFSPTAKFTGCALTNQNTGSTNIAQVNLGPDAANTVTACDFVMALARLDDGTATYWPGPAQNLSLTGNAIASAEASGSGVLKPVVTASGIGTAEAFGTLWLDPVLKPAQILSLVDPIGSPTLTPGPTAVDPGAIGTGELVGATVVSPGAATLALLSMLSTEAFGALALVDCIALTALPSAEAFGALGILPGPVIVGPNGIASGEVVDGTVITPGAATLAAAGIDSVLDLGAVVILPGPVTVGPGGLDSVEGFGGLVLVPGAALLDLAGIASAEAEGHPVMGAGGTFLVAHGIDSGEIVAALAAMLPGPVELDVDAIASLAAVGASRVLPGAILVAPPSLDSHEALGAAVTWPGAVTLGPAGIASVTSIGDVIATPGAVLVVVAGIADPEAIGRAIVKAVSLITRRPVGSVTRRPTGDPEGWIYE